MPFKAYIKPFDSSGQYVDEYIDVTDDMDLGKIGSIQRSLDSTDYDVGVFKPASLRITLRNDHGKYSEVGGLESIFDFKRTNSKFKLTWSHLREGYLRCGFFTAGEERLGEEIEVFEGLIDDSTSESEIGSQNAEFFVLGFESIFDQVKVPFSDLANGDLLSEILLAILDQPEITGALTVSAANISLALDQAIDVVDDFENKTVKEALDKILLASDSVLYVEEEVVYITSRTASSDVVHTFRGQASESGIEDIKNIDRIRPSGKLFNFWTWNDTSLSAEDPDSEEINGVRKKEIEFDEFTNNTKRQNILDQLLESFKDNRQAMTVTCPIRYELLAIGFLDKVAIDYPTVLFSPDEEFPILGHATYETCVFPFEEFHLTIDKDDDRFKVMAIELDTKQETISFDLEKIP